jgi:hypothetical protein
MEICNGVEERTTKEWAVFFGNKNNSILGMEKESQKRRQDTAIGSLEDV